MRAKDVTVTLKSTNKNTSRQSLVTENTPRTSRIQQGIIVRRMVRRLLLKAVGPKQEDLSSTQGSRHKHTIVDGKEASLEQNLSAMENNHLQFAKTYK